MHFQKNHISWFWWQDCKLLGMKPGKPSRRTITTINEDSVWQNDFPIHRKYFLELFELKSRCIARKAKYTPKYRIIDKSCECSPTSSFQVVTWGKGNWNGGTTIKVIFKIWYHNLTTLLSKLGLVGPKKVYIIRNSISVMLSEILSLSLLDIQLLLTYTKANFTIVRML